MRPEEATLEQLKARGFDIIRHSQALQAELQLIEQELLKREKEMKENAITEP